MDKVVALCKRRGFIFVASDIYGGIANTYDYGHYGVLLKNNVINAWWKAMIQERDDIVALDSSIILPLQTWVASGHVGAFSDPLTECQSCHKRFRADHLQEGVAEKKNKKARAGEEIDPDDVPLAEIACPSCGNRAWTDPREFNMMLKTYLGAVEDESGLQLGKKRWRFTATGVDEVELLLAANTGAEPRSLSKGASGGELSRVMLALEVALSGADPVPTMVFDEVDAGVGGRAAVEIGRRLARLAARHQVIVVTHLPQVAAYADTHLVVDKAARGGGVVRSSVRKLPDDERIGELARMLAGMDDTDTGRAHAEELLGAARSHREADRADANGPRRTAR